MKTLTKHFLPVIAVFIFLPPSLWSQEHVVARSFYSTLSPHGHWLTIEGGVTVWHPVFVPKHWHPYTIGRWVWTRWGWYWDSEEPFGWLVYHYGRWYYHDFYGWLWFPDDEWGPAWVSWRYTDEYIGWAPLPPVTVVHISFHRAHYFHHRQPHENWCFVPYDIFTEHIHHHHIPFNERKHIYEKSSTFEKGNHHQNTANIFTPEFIEQKSGRYRTTTSTGRTFGTERGGRDYFDDNTGRQNERRRTNEFVEESTQSQSRKTQRSSGSTQREERVFRPRVAPNDRAPQERREELLQRYEQQRITPPVQRPNRRNNDTETPSPEKSSRRR